MKTAPSHAPAASAIAKEPPRRPAEGHPQPAPAVWLQLATRIQRADDPLEREADQMADRVMRMRSAPSSQHAAPAAASPAPWMQRKCAECEEEERLQRKCAECEEEENRLQRKEISDAGGEVAPPIVHEVLRSTGQPLNEGTRRYFEARFAQNFENVRVHTGPEAAASARAVNGLAYTVGRNVVFGAGQYAPGTVRGQRLLAHELTHVLQQGARGRLALQRHSCREGEGPPAAELPIAGEPGPHPLVYRGVSANRSRRPAVGDAQELLNRFLQQLTSRDFTCADGADLGAINQLRATLNEDPLEVDCRFGPNTETATKMFQRCVFPGQPAEWDGKIGPKTWAELERLRNAPNPDGPMPVVPGFTTDDTFFDNVSVWINAFIPRDISGLTRVVPAGRHTGKTMIGGPLYISDCFLTDQRSFSSRFGALSRMRHLVLVGVRRAPFRQLGETKVCDTTHEIDCEDGDEECSASGATDRMIAFTSTIPGSLFGPRLRVHFVGASSNPCFSGSPDIDYGGDVKMNFIARRIDFSMLVDRFPAFEMYVSVDDGVPIALFQEPPPAGSSPADLFGGATKRISGFRFF